MENGTNRSQRFLRWGMTFVCISLLGIACIAFTLHGQATTTHADSTIPAWNGNFVTYTADTLVTYNGSVYECIQTHTSEPNWTPDATPALWQLQTSGTDGVTPTPTTTNTITAEAVTPTPSTQGSFGSTLLQIPTPGAITPTPTSTPSMQGTVAPSPTPSDALISVKVTFYTDDGTMADGQQTHVGACAVYIPQFPLGTEIALYDPNNLSTPVYTCTAEDTGTAICQNDIDVAMPGQVNEAISKGAEQLMLKITGFDSTVAAEAAANHPASQGCEG